MVFGCIWLGWAGYRVWIYVMSAWAPPHYMNCYLLPLVRFSPGQFHFRLPRVVDSSETHHTAKLQTPTGFHINLKIRVLSSVTESALEPPKKFRVSTVASWRQGKQVCFFLN